MVVERVLRFMPTRMRAAIGLQRTHIGSSAPRQGDSSMAARNSFGVLSKGFDICCSDTGGRLSIQATRECYHIAACQ